MAWTREKSVFELKDLETFVSSAPRHSKPRAKPRPPMGRRHDVIPIDCVCPPNDQDLQIHGKPVQRVAHFNGSSAQSSSLVHPSGLVQPSAHSSSLAPKQQRRGRKAGRGGRGAEEAMASSSRDQGWPDGPQKHRVLEVQFLSARHSLLKAYSDQLLLLPPSPFLSAPFGVSITSRDSPDVTATSRDRPDVTATPRRSHDATSISRDRPDVTTTSRDRTDVTVTSRDRPGAITTPQDRRDVSTTLRDGFDVTEADRGRADGRKAGGRGSVPEREVPATVPAAGSARELPDPGPGPPHFLTYIRRLRN